MMTSLVDVQEVVQITPPVESLLITHTQNHAYTCPEELCSFTTSSPSLLGLHKAKVHNIKTGVKKGVVHQYFCPALGCQFKPHSGRFFKVLDHLKTHFMKIHFEKKFKCSKCMKAFGLERDCLRHEKVCGQTFTCDECSKEYINKSALSNHCLTKGHKPPACLQKVPKTPKGDSTRTPPKEKRKNLTTVSILPKFPLPKNMSILVPTNKKELVRETLCGGSQTAFRQVPCSFNQETNSTGLNGQPCALATDNNSEMMVGSTPMSQGISGIGTGFALLSFNTPSQKCSITHNRSALRVRSEQKDQHSHVCKAKRSSVSRQSQKHISSPAAKLIDIDQCNRVLIGRPKGQSHERVLSSGIRESSTSSTLSSSGPLSGNFKVLSRTQKVQTSNSTPSTKSIIPIQISSSFAPNACVEMSHGVETFVNSAIDNDNVIKLRERIAPIQLPPGDGSYQSKETQIEMDDISDLFQRSLDTESDVLYNSGSMSAEYLPLSTAQTQTSVPYPSGYLLNDSETQTLESFMFNSLNSLLTDCETQTFESCLPFCGHVNDSETQTIENTDTLYRLINNCDKQFSDADPLCSLLNDSGTQTFPKSTCDSITQTLRRSALTDSTAQTSSKVLSLETNRMLSSEDDSFPFTYENNSCQVDPGELFMNEAVTTFDIMTQTYSFRDTTERRATSMSKLSASDDVMAILPKLQNIMTQTIGLPEATDVLLDVNVTQPPNVNEDKTPSVNKTCPLAQKYDSFDMPSPLFESYDPSVSSMDFSVASTKEAVKFVNPKVQQQKPDNVYIPEAVNQSLIRDDYLTPSLNVIDAGTAMQTLASSDIMTQTPKMCLSVNGANSDTHHTSVKTLCSLTQSESINAMTMQQPFETFDSVTQTVADCDTLSQIADGLIETCQKTSSTDLQTKQNLVALDSVNQTVNSLNPLTQDTTSFNTMTQTDNNFDIMTQTANNFDTMTQTSYNFDNMSQTEHGFDIMTQTANGFDTTTQTAYNFDSQTQTATNFDSQTQTATNFETQTQTTYHFDTQTQTAYNFDMQTQKTINFDTQTQTAINFDTQTQTAINFDTQTQTANNFDNMTQTANNFDNMTQTANSFDNLTQTANNFDNLTQTANSFENITQTANNFDNMAQSANAFDNMTETVSIFDNMTQTSDCFDIMTQTPNAFDNMTQTVNIFDTMTQTSNAFDNMTQTVNIFDTMTQTANSFDNMSETVSIFDNMTQTSDGFDIMTQTPNVFDNMTQTQTVNIFDTMTQTPNAFDNMTQTVNILDTMTQTPNAFDNMTQTVNIFDTMTQTPNAFDNMTQTVNIFDTMTQTSNAFDNMTQTANNFANSSLGCEIFTQTGENESWERMTQTDPVFIQEDGLTPQTTDSGLWTLVNQEQETGCDMTTQTIDNGLWDMTSEPELDGQASDMMTQTADDNLWEMVTQTEKDFMSDMMTQTTGVADLLEAPNDADQVQGSDRTTQTAEKDLWDMMTQTGDDNLWAVTPQASFDPTCDIFTQTGEMEFWDIAPQTGLDLGSDIFTQTDSNSLWEMSTQTDTQDIGQGDIYLQTNGTQTH